MIVKTRKTYQCEHCKKIYVRKDFAETHEERCSKNPENHRPCFGCIHCEMKKEQINEDHPIVGETSRDVEALYCNKLSHFLIPPKSEHKGNAYEFWEQENKPMPKTCEHTKETIFS